MKKVCYNVVLQSQLGPRSGELLLQESEAGTVSGELCLLNCRNHFSGALRSRVGKEPYDAIFTIRQGCLCGGLVTSHGCWDLKGAESADAARKTEQPAFETAL